MPVPGLRLQPMPANASDDSISYYLKLYSDTMEPGDPNFDYAVRMQNYMKEHYNKNNTHNQQVTNIII